MTEEEFKQIAIDILARVYIEKAGEVPTLDWFISTLYGQIKENLK